MKVKNQMTLSFPSVSANESFARAVAACFMSQTDPTLEELNDVKTAVSEAVTNCIVHAYPDKIGSIRLKGKLYNDGRVEFTIQDKGIGIDDIKKARTPLYTTGGSDRSGMGFTIMESFMDKLVVKSKTGSGTTVKLTKRISSRGREA